MKNELLARKYEAIADSNAVVAVQHEKNYITLLDKVKELEKMIEDQKKTIEELKKKIRN